MSFGFSVGDILATIKLANSIREKFANAPEQFKELSNELAGLSNLLQYIENVLSQQDISEWQKKALIYALEGCRGVLGTLHKFVEENSHLKPSSVHGLRGKSLRVWERLTFKCEELKELRSRVILNVGLLDACRGSLNCDLTFAIKEGVEILRDRQDAHELCKDLQEWLTPVDFANQQSDFLRRRHEKTGQWVLESNEFQSWITQKNQTLFCPGIPGTGKTIITAIVISDLQSTFQNQRDIGISYLYCGFRQDNQTSEDLLANLLKQLLYGPPFTETVKALYDDHKAKRTRPLLDQVSSALYSVMSLYARVYIIIDALDELSDVERKRFLPEILKLRARTGSSLFATSRFIPEIVKEFEGSMKLEIRATKEDIQSYLDRQITLQLPSFVKNKMELQNDIKTQICKVVDGIFLLAQLYIDFLRGKRSAKAIRIALKSLPTGSGAYDCAYENAIKRIEGQIEDTRELAMQVLAWITCARRPLTIAELQHALAIEPNTSELDEENMPQIDDMVSACAGLVTVDVESEIIRLVHYTVQEYFVRMRKQKGLFLNIETEITDTCVTYLSFSTFNSGFCQTDSEFEERLRVNSLYDYAAVNWGYHARKASSSSTKLVTGFLQDIVKCEAASQAMTVPKNGRSQNYSQGVPKNVTGLHLAAYFGIEEAVKALLSNESSLEWTDSYGQTPLFWAAKSGHETVVKLLLEDRMNVNSRDKDGLTPLSHAAREGHHLAIEEMLKKDAEADLIDNFGGTPLSWASEYGHDAVVKLLLELSVVQVNSRNAYGLTPLAWASVSGHDRIVEMLLKYGADANMEDIHGQSPLWWAITRNHNRVIEILIAKGVDANIKDEMSRTPLSHAAEDGRENMVELLLGSHTVDVNTKCDNGRTPLSYAAEEGHEAVVKLLLDSGRCDADAKDRDGWTSLAWAADEGRESIVQLLLETDGVNPASINKWGQSPLSRAAKNGHQAVAMALLAKNGSHADVEDATGWTPLLQAAMEGHGPVVELLLAQDNVNPDHKDVAGRTSLSWAAGLGQEAIARRLLVEGGVDADSKDNRNRTPLWWAAKSGHNTVVGLLVSSGANVNCKDTYGRRPLEIAARNGHDKVIKLLLENGAGLDDCGTTGWTALQMATLEAHKEVERLLQAEGASEPEDFYGITAMFFQH